jgi:hypothetical protein
MTFLYCVPGAVLISEMRGIGSPGVIEGAADSPDGGVGRKVLYE